MRSSAGDALAAVARALGKLGARWYVFGAQAAILYGARRTTADLDVTVDLTGASTRDLIVALAAEGLSVRVPDAEAFLARARVLPLAHEPTGYGVDLLAAGPGLEEQFLARARLLDVEDVRVPVACVEDIVAMKVLGGRPKDLDDVVEVLTASRTAFDVELARTTLRLLEQALDRSDLVSVFEEAWRRAARPPT